MSYAPTLASNRAVPSSALIASNCSTRLTGFTLASGSLAPHVPTATSGNVHLRLLAAASFPLTASCALNEQGAKSNPAIAKAVRILFIELIEISRLLRGIALALRVGLALARLITAPL